MASGLVAGGWWLLDPAPPRIFHPASRTWFLYLHEEAAN